MEPERKLMLMLMLELLLPRSKVSFISCCCCVKPASMTSCDAKQLQPMKTMQGQQWAWLASSRQKPPHPRNGSVL